MSPARAHPWWLGPAARLGAGVLWLLGRTWRMRRVRMAEVDAALERGERCIFALWHARLLGLVYTHRGRDVAVLVSRHRDGEWIARIIERLGYRAARGSSTRGGEEGLREMLLWAERGHLLALTPDGPRGPRERVKPGLVYLAQRTGWPVVPVASSGRPCWVMKSWDRFQVPKPFARVVTAYGEPLRVPRELAPSEVETWQARLDEAIRAVTREVARLSGEEQG